MNRRRCRTRLCRPQTSMPKWNTTKKEHNLLFRSSRGVCVGPPAMIQEFLSVLAEEQPLDGDDKDVLDQSVQATLNDVDPAFDYCLLGLKTHALVFSLWPIMGQAYEQLLAIVKD